MGVISPIPTDANGQPKQTGALQQLGKDDYLQLLITKLENQDPMKPMADEDFVAQLAQFSTLEQMNNIAEGMGESNELDYLQMQSINNTMAAGLIGNDIKAQANGYSGVLLSEDDPATISFSLSDAAATVDFVITDALGREVRSVTVNGMAPGEQLYAWNGEDNNGDRVRPGVYDVDIRAYDGNGDPIDHTMRLVGPVESIAYRDGAAYLQVNGKELSLGDIIAIGRPGAFTVEAQELDD